MQVAVGECQPTQRMFFALWPEPALQRALAHIARSMQVAFGGRIVETRNIHLTLAFLGSVPAARVDDVLAIGASIRAARFSLNLVETGCWKRSAVAWIAPDTSPQPLEDLVRALRQQLLDARIGVDDKPFAPHVTLVRKAQCQPHPVRQTAESESLARSTGIPVAWHVDSFVLIRSDTLQTGPVYTRVGAWQLI